VPTLDGKRTLSIPAGTQSGEVLMFRGEGIRNLRGYGRGDQYVRVVVHTPTNLAPRQEELLREFEASSNGTPDEKAEKGFLWNFWQKLSS
jgi:molecular chaperone DnaJ